MREGGGGRGIGEIIGRHVHGLHGCDGPEAGGSNTLLQQTHISGQSGLVPHCGGDAAQQRRHLGARLRESEDVVDEQQHVLALYVSEVLCDRETGEGHAGAGSWGLVHLSVHKGCLGSGDGLAILVHLDHASLDHLVVEIVTLTGALAHTGEYGVTSVVHGDVVDQLHDHHRLAYTGSPEQADLSSLRIGGQQVHHLDAGHEDLLGLALLREEGGGPVNGGEDITQDGALLVHGLSDDVQNTAQGAGADGHHDGGALVDHLLSSDQPLCCLHGNSAHGVLSQMLGHLQHEAGVALGHGHLKGVEDGGQGSIELHIHHGTDDLGDNTTLDKDGGGVTPRSQGAHGSGDSLQSAEHGNCKKETNKAFL
mmetsp:Transcript_16102/g.35688  ORF Transcript_16102/g.35688 Transcript_16102/m.35688 type:complete len:366 (+) Transcript_16102:789-1886(+)